ncbi:MAG: YbbC/YhhH family protein [Acidobacteriia bacterium]|nr:YbbC/YhhH family protein [Terriglobia bacterium]
MINLLRVCTVMLLLITASNGMRTGDRRTLPSQGIVPDEVTAVKIAEAVFPPIFGTDEVAKCLPYHAQLKDGFWTVYGTLKPGARGGTPQMTIQKKDGKVIEVWHSQ